MKKDYAILAGLLAVGAIVWYFFSRSTLGQSGGTVTPTATTVTPDTSGVSGGYPNSQPIQMGKIEIGGSPINLTYNYPAPQQSPTVSEECTNCKKRGSCADYGTTVPQVRLTFRPSDMQRLSENLADFTNKISSGSMLKVTS